MDNVISISGLSKTFGKVAAVHDISLVVPKGSVFGFLGPNGAGKSTTINMLVNFLRPTAGDIKIFGLDSVQDSVEILRRVGFLAGDFALDRGLTGWQQIEYFGALRGGFDRSYVAELAERLDCKLDRKFKHLSRGNKQKVGLITALMHKPELLIFDEPTSGLDPLIQAEFNKIILEQKAQGVTTFISSHVLSEVQEICDYVTFIRKGEIVASKPLVDVMKDAARQVVARGVTKQASVALRKVPGVQNYQTIDGDVRFAFQGDVNVLLKALAGIKMTDLTIQESDLESIFMNYYEDTDA